jgi:metal-responsive CopG/Arc/MetJ family transcriptional regulator
MKRGAVTKRKARQVIIWFPEDLLESLDSGVQTTDSDRSKFIRNAVREKISRITEKAA